MLKMSRFGGLRFQAPGFLIPIFMMAALGSPPVFAQGEARPPEAALQALPELALPAPPDLSAEIAGRLASMAVPLPEPAILPEPRTPILASFETVPTQIAPPAETPSVTFPGDIRFSLDLDDAKLRAFIEPLRVKFKIRPPITEGFAAFYRQRDFAPVWPGLDNAVATGHASLRATLGEAHRDGLDSPRLLSAIPDNFAALSREERDLTLSFAAYLYAHDARGGRLDPVRLSSLLTPKLFLPEPELFLAALAETRPAGLEAMLGTYNPGHRDYRALKTKLAALRHEEANPHTSSIGDAPVPALLPAGFMGETALAPGARDPRIAHLRTRLGLPSNLPASDELTYSPELVEAVKTFQRANGLTPNGRLTPRTRAMLEDRSTPINAAERKPDRAGSIAQIIANMERWRWLPPQLGQTHIFVNIPQFRLKMMGDDAIVFETRVIVGKPETQTPVFSDAMDFLVVNPSWFVPPSILKKEFIPRLAADPEYAKKRGYDVVRRGNSISVRQPPGDRNALGYVKFMFPNLHSVYLHDTPGRHLFASETRAFSHGCVRVEGPFRMAEQLLLAHQGFTEAQLRGMIGRGERTIKLTQKVPVHLAYFTVQVDEAGVMRNFRDLYGHDARIKKALAL